MSRLALVTGGATGNDGVGGIGAAICAAFARTGHRVAVADIDGAGAERTASTIAANDLVWLKIKNPRALRTGGFLFGAWQ